MKTTIHLVSLVFAIVFATASVATAFVILATKGPIADYSNPTALTIGAFIAGTLAVATYGK